MAINTSMQYFNKQLEMTDGTKIEIENKMF